MREKIAHKAAEYPRNSSERGDKGEQSLLDHALSRLQRRLFGRRPYLPLVGSVLVYASAVFVFGESLAISCNYLVIVPVLAAALAYGLPGGFVAGLLGLPANLLLFAIIGHPEYSPASKPIAELSGLVVGSSLGYLADYLRALEAEITRRRFAETSLREALVARDLLLHEVHHRVKNNLNVIKSLIQLQKNRSSDAGFIEAADELIGRIFAIALIHDQLYREEGPPAIEPERYLTALVAHIEARESGGRFQCALQVESGDRLLSPDAATPLGLILNEILTNAARHAFEDIAEPAVAVRFALEADRFKLTVGDNGRGFSPGEGCPEGLGLKIVRTLSRQLGGSPSFSSAPGQGCLFELSFPPGEPSPSKGRTTTAGDRGSP